MAGNNEGCLHPDIYLVTGLIVNWNCQLSVPVWLLRLLCGIFIRSIFPSFILEMTLYQHCILQLCAVAIHLRRERLILNGHVKCDVFDMVTEL